MSHTIINPTDLHHPVPFGYSHTAAVPAGSDLVLVAGQYASDSNGEVTSTEFADQVRRTFENLATALAAHGVGLDAVVQLRTYIVGLDFGKLGALAAEVGCHWGDTPPPNTVLGVAGLAMPDIRFEVEALACKPSTVKG